MIIKNMIILKKIRKKKVIRKYYRLNYVGGSDLGIKFIDFTRRYIQIINNTNLDIVIIS